MNSDGFPARLGLLIGTGSVNSFAEKCGISEASIRTYIRGTTPGIDKAALIAQTTGVSLDWLITGRGEMYPSSQAAAPESHGKLEEPTSPAFAEEASVVLPASEALMAKVTDAIAKLHRDMGFKLPDARLGALVFQTLAEIGRFAESQDEYDAHLTILMGRMRRKLQSAEAAPGSGKRSASAS